MAQREKIRQNRKRTALIGLSILLLWAGIANAPIYDDNIHLDSPPVSSDSKIPSPPATNDEGNILALPEFKAPQQVMLVDPHLGSDGRKLQFSSESAVNVVWTKDRELSDFLSDKSDIPNYLKKYGLSYVWVDAQVDWSLDSPNDWKYSPSWDHLQKRISGSDWEFVNLGALPVLTETIELLRTGYSLDNYRWRNDPKGLHAVLKDGQFETFFQSPQNEQLRFDWSKHTLYSRVRYVISYTYEDSNQRHYVATPWSKVASYGYSGEVTPKFHELQSPQLEDIQIVATPSPHMTFSAIQDKDTIDNLCLAVGRGFPIEMEIQARRQAHFWEKMLFRRPQWRTISIADKGSIISPGHREISLKSLYPDLAVGELVQVRSRYRYADPAIKINSPWSPAKTLEVTKK